MKALSHSLSYKGEDHFENEDSLLADDTRGLYAVADGVTIPSGGKDASNLVIDTLTKTFQGNLPQAVIEADTIVSMRQQTDPKIGSTTLEAVHVSETGKVQVVHVGDSACYILVAGDVRKLETQPQHIGHSLLNSIPHMTTPTTFREIVFPDDYIILATDGVTDHFPAGNYSKLISSLGYPEPGLVARTVMAQVLGTASRTYRDDASLIVVKVLS